MLVASFTKMVYVHPEYLKNFLTFNNLQDAKKIIGFKLICTHSMNCFRLKKS